MRTQWNGQSRRTFLNNLIYGVGALSTSHLVPFPTKESYPLSKITRAPQNVVIIGAGMAGLAAGWELQEAGHQVKILEARTRPGGKVYTLRQPFAGDLHAEAGAIGFSDTYTQANKYIAALGLKKVYLSMPTYKTVYYLKGKRLAIGPGDKPTWPYDITGEENDLGPIGIIDKYFLKTLPEERSNPQAWSSAALSGLDGVSLGDYMLRHGATMGAVELVRDTMWFGIHPFRTSMLATAISDFGLYMGGAPFMLEGGNDSLPRKMAEKIHTQVYYGIEVEAIMESNGQVHVSASRRGENMTFQADQVICTIPASVLRGIKFSPALPVEKEEALKALPHLDVTRTHMQIQKAFWQEEGNDGTAFTDQSMTIYEHPLYKTRSSSERCILEGYVFGREAYTLGKKAKNEVVEFNLDIMEKVHPGISKYFEGYHITAWCDDRYSLGGPSWASPGDINKYLKVLQQPHGKIHFAGEYTTILRSTMEGALRSGARAAAAIHNASQ